MSKLEKNNKDLLILTRDRFINNQYVAEKYTSTLELKRFENFSTGFDLNAILLDIPSFKSTFHLNGGIRYGRTSIRDSIRVFRDNQIINNGFVKEFGVNTFQVLPRFVWEVKADERYNFTMSYTPTFLFLRSNEFQQVDNINNYDRGSEPDPRKKYVYNNVNLTLAFRPQASGPGRLFFRYQFNWQQGYWRTGFHQAQVGYSFYLTRPLKQNNSTTPGT